METRRESALEVALCKVCVCARLYVYTRCTCKDPWRHEYQHRYHRHQHRYGHVIESLGVSHLCTADLCVCMPRGAQQALLIWCILEMYSLFHPFRATCVNC